LERIIRAINSLAWSDPICRTYAYVLTPQGVTGKARVTADFLRRKLVEYETLTRQIAELQQELNSTPADQAD
jgi:hypothetical protein